MSWEVPRWTRGTSIWTNCLISRTASSDELPEPEAGMVVRFGYQWVDPKQHQKDRPACVAFFKLRPDPRTAVGSNDPVLVKEVIYLPISTKPPGADQSAVKIPDQVRRHLGLPDESWIVISECNVVTCFLDEAAARGADLRERSWRTRRAFAGLAPFVPVENLRLLRVGYSSPHTSGRIVVAVSRSKA